MSTPPRPDQEIDPPPAVLAPGGASGIFRGRLVIVNGQIPPAGGIFLYDQFGNLIGYWISLPGTDPLLGSTLANIGITVQDTTTPKVSANLQDDGLIIEKFSGGGAPPQIAVLDDTATAPFGGVQITPGGIIQDTWHAMSPLSNSWVAAAPAPQYRAIASPQNTVEIIGNLTHTSISGNSVIFTLPSAYWPASNQRWAFGNSVATDVYASAPAAPYVQVNPSGVVTIGNMPSGTTDVQFHCLISLDA
jgi:hypothetical protein